MTENQLHYWGAPPPPWLPEEKEHELRIRLTNALRSFCRCANDILDCKTIVSKFSEAVNLLASMTLTENGISGAEQYWTMESDKTPALSNEALEFEMRLQQEMASQVVPELAIVRFQRYAAVLIAHDAGKTLKDETDMMRKHVENHPRSIRGYATSPEYQRCLRKLGTDSMKRLLAAKEKLIDQIASLEAGKFQEMPMGTRRQPSLGRELRGSHLDNTKQMSRRVDTVIGATDEPYRTDRFEELLEMDAHIRGRWIAR
ncbi:hypothetical protein SLS55_004879 [Diplodia seriata]|uniref:Uncharacterized protein n=1 Tax=Diplodia seriata TaxID=420778 RepID=A0ABR3CKM4_9PEZI